MALNLNLSEENDIVHDAPCPREQSEEMGPVLLAITDMQGVVEQIRDKFDSILNDHSSFSKLTTDLSRNMEAGLKSLKSIEEKISGHGTYDVKTKRLSNINLQHLMYAVGPERAVLPLLTWAIICTVMSYVRAMPCLRFWVSDSMWSKMSPHGDILDSSQGIAMVLFAAKNNSKAKLATPPGKMWTFLMRRALRSGIIFAKANLFRKEDSAAPVPSSVARSDAVGGRPNSVSATENRSDFVVPKEPEWMSRFASNAEIVRAVNDSMRKFEGNTSDVNASSAPTESVSDGGGTRPRKRRKGGSGAGESDHELRMFVVKHIRSVWCERMNQGRTAVRMHLYKKVIFILDKISHFKDVETAARKGYKIILGSESSPAETIHKNSRNVEGGIWNIPDAHGNEVDNAQKRNRDLLRQVMEDFSSLHVTIVYKKQVKMDSNEVDIDADQTLTNREYLSVTEKVSLHEVANEMLMEIFSCEDSASVLTVSQLSLKAIHVLAVALRGFVEIVLCKYSAAPTPPSEMHLAAIGKDVTLDDEKGIAVMMEKYVKNGRGKVTDTYASCYRDKFSISKEDAKKLRQSIEEEGEGTAAGCCANRSGLSNTEQDDIGFEEWIYKK